MTRRSRLQRKAAILFAVVLCFGALAYSAESQWTPANFRGLTPGKSRVSDMKGTLGEPDKVEPAANSKAFDVYRYKAKGDLQGDLEVTVRRSSSVIQTISENLPVALPRTPAYRRFGSDYRSVMYSRADCAKKDGQAPLYRDKNGSVEMIEYPAKGIALALDQYGYDVASVRYLSSAPGIANAPACVARTRSKTSHTAAKGSGKATPTGTPAKANSELHKLH